MTDKLPPNLLALFAPRPALRYLPPSDHAPEQRQTNEIQGVAAFLPALEEWKGNDGFIPTESWMQRRDRIRQEKKEKQHKLLTEGIQECTILNSFSVHSVVQSFFGTELLADIR